MIRVVMTQKKLFHCSHRRKHDCVEHGGMAPSSSLQVFLTGKLRIMQEHIGSFGNGKSGNPFGIAGYSVASEGRLMIGPAGKPANNPSNA